MNCSLKVIVIYFSVIVILGVSVSVIIRYVFDDSQFAQVRNVPIFEYILLKVTSIFPFSFLLLSLAVWWFFLEW